MSHIVWHLFINIVTWCDSEQDYNYHIMCKTSTKEYVVPIFARGPRPILDFPDEVVFPVVAVKSCMSKPILVRNVGDRPAEIVLAIGEYVLASYVIAVFTTFSKW